ncbi:NrsF family protein [Parasphingorhabdus sp.]|uniref:NrsF family protein n=1 Tax=Parasphingorhabdus sp. TaxID=2709688 RepID=UPI003A93B4E2
MNGVADNLIDKLVDDLEPVRTLNPKSGLAIACGLALSAAVAVAAMLGVRHDLKIGMVDEMFFLRSGVLLMLGLATAIAVTNMARPGVGKLNRGWIWALVTAGLFPLTTAIMSMINMPPVESLRPMEGLKCLTVSGIAALAIGSGLTWWLRRGAPTSPERAGWLVGVASGALGAMAYNLHCPFNDIYYIGLWFTIPVIVSAVIGRLIIPRLIRW